MKIRLTPSDVDDLLDAINRCLTNEVITGQFVFECQPSQNLGESDDLSVYVPVAGREEPKLVFTTRLLFG